MKPLLAKVGLAFASVVGALGVAEVALRGLGAPGRATAASDRGFFARFDPELGWAPKPSVSGVHRDKGFSVSVAQNRFGVRGPEDLETGRRGASRRILVLGDSYVWGFGVSQEDLFSDPRVHGSDVEIVNLGVSGYGTDQALLLYRRLGSRFEVDEVVLAFTPYNDVDNNLASRQYDREKPFFTVQDGELRLHDTHVVDWALRSRMDALRVQSRVLNLIDGAALRIRNRLLRASAGNRGAAAPRHRRLRAEDVTARDREGVELTGALIRTLAEEVRARGPDFLVVFVPYKPHVLANAAENHPLVPLLAAMLAAHGIPYLEPYASFLAAQREGQSLFNPLDNHWSPAGHREFARHLVDATLRDRTRNLYAR